MFGKTGVEQCQLERVLSPLGFGPVQQLMRGKGVHDPAVLVEIEGKVRFCAQSGQSITRLLALFRGRAVFFDNMFAQVLPLGARGRVQLKRIASAGGQAGFPVSGLHRVDEIQQQTTSETTSICKVGRIPVEAMCRSGTALCWALVWLERVKSIRRVFASSHRVVPGLYAPLPSH